MMQSIDHSRHIPDLDSLLRPSLFAISCGESKLSDIDRKIADSMKLGEAARKKVCDLTFMNIFTYRVHCVKNILVKAGMVEALGMGYFRITSQGKEVLDSSPERFDRHYLERTSPR